MVKIVGLDVQDFGVLFLQGFLPYFAHSPPNLITIALWGTKDKVQKTETDQNPVVQECLSAGGRVGNLSLAQMEHILPGLYRPKVLLPLPGPLSPLRVEPEDVVFPIYPSPNPILCSEHHSAHTTPWP